MKLRRFYLILLVGLVLSILWGYWKCDTPVKALILRDLGYGSADVWQIIFSITVVMLLAEYGGSALIFLASYQSGKDYKLTISSSMIFLVLLVSMVLIGNLVGLIIRLMEVPQYQSWIISPSRYFLLEVLWHLPSLVLWSSTGILVSNYRRELYKEKDEL